MQELLQLNKRGFKEVEAFMVSLARVQPNSLGQGKPWCRSFFNQTQVSVNVAEIFGGAGWQGANLATEEYKANFWFLLRTNSISYSEVAVTYGFP